MKTSNIENRLPSTSELFEKHFGDTAAVGIFHPNSKSFFEELNQVCLKEDRINGKLK